MLSDLPQPLDTTRRHRFTLRGAGDSSLRGVFTGLEAFEALLLAGDDRAPAATLAAEWDPDVPENPTGLDEPVGRLTIAADALVGLEPGTYGVRVRLNPATDRLLVLDDEVKLEAAPGTAAAPRAYCTFRDMQDVVPWIGTARYGEVEQAGFGEARVEATRLLDATVLARAADELETMDRTGVWDPARRAGLESIRAHLAAGRLLVDAEVRAIAARHAIDQVLTRDVGSEVGAYGTSGRQKIGQRSGARAQRMVVGWTAWVDADGDGVYELAL